MIQKISSPVIIQEAITQESILDPSREIRRDDVVALDQSESRKIANAFLDGTQKSILDLA